MRAIVSSNLAVVDRSDPAVRSFCAPDVGPSTLVCRAPSVARRAITGGSVEITRCVVTRLGLAVAELRSEVTRTRRLPRTLAVLGRLRTILGRQLSVVDGLGAIRRGLSTPGGGLGAFVGGVLAVARRAVPCASVEVTRRVVACLGLSVAQPGGHITVLRREPGFTATNPGQLIGPRIFEVLGRLRSIFGSYPAVVDRLSAVVRRSSSPGGGLGAFVRRVLTLLDGSITCIAVEVTSRDVARLGLPVAEPGREVAILRSQPGLAPAHSGLLVSPRIRPVLGRVRAIGGRHLAVVDGVSAVVRRIIAPGGLRTIGDGLLTVARRVVTGFCLSVATVGFAVAHIGGQVPIFGCR